jgi:hypothetical protein
MKVQSIFTIGSSLGVVSSGLPAPFFSGVVSLLIAISFVCFVPHLVAST